MTKANMSKIEVLQTGNPILRKVSSAILVSKIKTPEIKKIISLLQSAIGFQSDAAAISAVQIGKPIRLFVISKKVFAVDSKKNSNEIKKTFHKVDGVCKMENKSDLIIINPKIVKTSKTKQLLEEGCLSVRYVYGKVLRPEKVTVEAHDENGKKFSRGFSGLLAQVVQHEIDHLNGILFTDKAADIQKITPEEYEKMLETL